MKQRRKYAPPRVLQQTGLMLETDLLGNSIRFNMYLESVDIDVREYTFTDSVDPDGFNPYWD
jgi:hypothetical protein